MPPKKQPKLDNVSLADRSHQSAKPRKSQGKKGKNSKRQPSKKARKVDHFENPELLRPSSPILQAASGAGIKSTAQLQEITRATRARTKRMAKTKETINQLAAPELESGPAEKNQGTDPSSSSGEVSSSSSSESDSDSDLDHSPSSSSEVQGNDPVKRKIPFDRERGQFRPVDVSPGSLENGKDVRDLAKLQDMLLTNPEAVTAIDSMLQVIKAMRSDATADNLDGQGSAINDQLPRPQEGQGVPLPPPPRGNQRLLQQDNRPGMSETTIYTHAVPSASPSQEVNMNLGVCMNRLVVSTDPNNPPGENLSADVLMLSEPQQPPDPSPCISEPSRHPEQGGNVSDNPVQLERQAAKERTERMILEAERQKLMLEKPVAGNKHTMTPQLKQLLDKPGSSDLSCDDNLFGLSVHLDDLMILRIESGEFVDFSKLIPTDKVVPEEPSNRMQLVTHEGKLGVAPFVDKDAITINSYRRWEIAFDVYAGVYTRAHPRRGPEMLEYKHIIRNASETYIWTNVYDYDKIHRRHMERNPGRTWAKKHKDIWSEKVKIYRSTAITPNSELLTPGKKRKPCRFFNKNGKCTKGANCEFDHKCAFCGLFGHGKHNCRKLAALKKENNPNQTPQSVKEAN